MYIQKAVLSYILICVQIKKLTHSSLCVFDNCGKKLSYKKLQYSYSIFTRRAKPIRIIGDPDNQLPDKWSSTLLNPLNAELNPICHLLALVGAHHILHVSGIRVNMHIFEMNK